jgi:hypothetical protein
MGVGEPHLNYLGQRGGGVTRQYVIVNPSFRYGSPLKPRAYNYSTAATLCLEPCPNLTPLLTASIDS